MDVVQTGDGSLTLVHKDHGEWFHSQDGAKYEAQRLYIESSFFQDSLTQPNKVSVLDVGLGLGYNACSTLEAWTQTPGPADLDILSLEHDEELLTQFKSGCSNWQSNWPLQWKSWCGQSHIKHPKNPSSTSWTLLLGDGKQELQKHDTHAPFHFIWQDPFSLAHGSTLWDKEWFQLLYQRSAQNCVLMTYSVARPVKDALEAGGWSIEKIPATTKKRHWLRATKRPLSEVRPFETTAFIH
ncbi:MAG: tRNA (5-methylaminomethyl-2-thiouridine)(34)-methyltransferase MnmD [Oligoflexales bacterium]